MTDNDTNTTFSHHLTCQHCFFRRDSRERLHLVLDRQVTALESVPPLLLTCFACRGANSKAAAHGHARTPVISTSRRRLWCTMRQILLYTRGRALPSSALFHVGLCIVLESPALLRRLLQMFFASGGRVRRGAALPCERRRRVLPAWLVSLAVCTLHAREKGRRVRTWIRVLCKNGVLGRARAFGDAFLSLTIRKSRMSGRGVFQSIWERAAACTEIGAAPAKPLSLDDG